MRSNRFSSCGPEFIRFINMLINDTTYLLDESLDGLKRIHDFQQLMADSESFSRLSRVRSSRDLAW